MMNSTLARLTALEYQVTSLRGDLADLARELDHLGPHLPGIDLARDVETLAAVRRFLSRLLGKIDPPITRAVRSHDREIDLGAGPIVRPEAPPSARGDDLIDLSFGAKGGPR